MKKFTPRSRLSWKQFQALRPCYLNPDEAPWHSDETRAETKAIRTGLRRFFRKPRTFLEIALACHRSDLVDFNDIGWLSSRLRPGFYPRTIDDVLRWHHGLPV